jgi:hypothetical protein
MSNLVHTTKSKSSKPLKPAHSGAASELDAATKLFTEAVSEAVSSFTEPALKERTAHKNRASKKIARAYAFIGRTMPDVHRYRLYEIMADALAEVKAQAGASASKNSAFQVREEGELEAPVDFLADMQRQSNKRREKDIAAKRLITGALMSKRLGISPQALSAALKAKRIFVLQGPSGGYYYPAFFADTRYDRRSLEKVCKALGDLPAGSKWDFFMAPRTTFGDQSPLDAIAKGKLDLVLKAAAAFVEE